jgi:hypothetical protein
MWQKDMGWAPEVGWNFFLRPKKSHRVQPWSFIQPINRSLNSKTRTALGLGGSAEQKKLKNLGRYPTMALNL